MTARARSPKRHPRAARPRIVRPKKPTPKPKPAFVATIPLTVSDVRREAMRDGFLAGAQRLGVTDLAVEVALTDVGLTITFGRITARNADTAKTKAIYWCRRICDASRFVRWHMTDPTKVEVRDA